MKKPTENEEREIVEKILKYLVSTRKINEHSLALLFRISSSNSLTLDLGVTTTCASRIRQNEINQIIQNGQRITSLSLANCLTLANQLATQLATHCVNLTYADFSYCGKLDSASLSAFVSLASNLKELRVLNCTELKNEVSIESKTLETVYFCTSSNMKILKIKCPELSMFDCSDCNSLIDIKWEENYRKLKDVFFFRCYQLSDEGFASVLCDTDGVSIIDLNIFACKNISLKTFIKFCEQSPGLIRLIITAVDVNDDWMNAIAKFCPNIEVLTMNSCPNVTTAGLEQVLTNCKKLHCLSVADCGIKDDLLLQFGTLAKQMKRLDLTDNKKFTNKGLASVLQGCQKLVLLSVCQCRVGDDAFEPLGNEIEYDEQEEKSLSLSQKFAKHKPKIGRFLVNLNLTNCNNITDKTLRLISTCPEIQELELFGNSNITDGALFTVLEGCPQLRSIHLQDCTQLTDITCNNILQHSFNLIDLDIYGCNLITEEGAKALFGITSLQEINVSSHLREKLKHPKIKIISSKAANY